MALAVGDRVKVVVPEPAFNGKMGKIVEYSPEDFGAMPYVVRLDNYGESPENCFREEELVKVED